MLDAGPIGFARRVEGIAEAHEPSHRALIRNEACHPPAEGFAPDEELRQLDTFGQRVVYRPVPGIQQDGLAIGWPALARPFHLHHVRELKADDPKAGCAELPGHGLHELGAHPLPATVREYQAPARIRRSVQEPIGFVHGLVSPRFAAASYGGINHWDRCRRRSPRCPSRARKRAPTLPEDDGDTPRFLQLSITTNTA